MLSRRNLPIGVFFGAVLGLSLLSMASCERSTSEKIDDIYKLKFDPTPRNIEALRDLLKHEDADLRVTAMNCLVTLDLEDSKEIAVAALEDNDAFIRATAAKLIGDMEDPAMAGFLIRHLKSDPDALVRRRACQGLIRSAGEGVATALVEALRDPDPQVRLEAIRGVKKLAPGQGTPRLIELLAQDPMWEIRVQAASALGLSGDPLAQQALESALQDQVEFVRAAAAKALRDFVIRSPDPVPDEDAN